MQGYYKDKLEPKLDLQGKIVKCKSGIGKVDGTMKGKLIILLLNDDYEPIEDGKGGFKRVLASVDNVSLEGFID